MTAAAAVSDQQLQHHEQSSQWCCCCCYCCCCYCFCSARRRCRATCAAPHQCNTRDGVRQELRGHVKRPTPHMQRSRTLLQARQPTCPHDAVARGSSAAGPPGWWVHAVAAAPPLSAAGTTAAAADAARWVVVLVLPAATVLVRLGCRWRRTPQRASRGAGWWRARDGGRCDRALLADAHLITAAAGVGELWECKVSD